MFSACITLVTVVIGHSLDCSLPHHQFNPEVKLLDWKLYLRTVDSCLNCCCQSIGDAVLDPPLAAVPSTTPPLLAWADGGFLIPLHPTRTIAAHGTSGVRFHSQLRLVANPMLPLSPPVRVGHLRVPLIFQIGDTFASSFVRLARSILPYSFAESRN